jgi:hypothetical protein
MIGSQWLRPLPLVTALALACAGGGEEADDTRRFVAFGEYAQKGDALPRVRYFEDGQLSVNDRCPVRRTKLNPNVRPVWVNGHPVGFC